jgi:hypothetical protein
MKQHYTLFKSHMCMYVGARVAQSVLCLTTDWTTGVQSPTEAEDFSSSFCILTGSGAHPASFTMGTGGPFPGGKAQPGRDADHSPLSSAEVKNELELYLLSPHAPPWRVSRITFYNFICMYVHLHSYCIRTLVWMACYIDVYTDTYIFK